MLAESGFQLWFAIFNNNSGFPFVYDDGLLCREEACTLVGIPR